VLYLKQVEAKARGERILLIYSENCSQLDRLGLISGMRGADLPAV
jgi:hypothetical protein